MLINVCLFFSGLSFITGVSATNLGRVGVTTANGTSCRTPAPAFWRREGAEPRPKHRQRCLCNATERPGWGGWCLGHPPVTF